MSYEESSVAEIIASRGYRPDIKGDKFSLYISNYPCNAEYLRSRIGNAKLVLAELCCSVGVTLEYLAPAFKKVVGVDLDQNILKTCKENLKTSGFFDKVELIEGDVFDDQVLAGIKADIVIYDVPFWYPHQQEKQGNMIEKNPPLKEMIVKIKKFITNNIIIFSPPEWYYEYFFTKLGALEFEQVFIDAKHNRNQIYLGGLMRKQGITKIELEENNSLRLLASDKAQNPDKS